MKVDIKKLPKSEVQLTITVPYEVYKKWEKKALEEFGKKMKIKGFRTGHIPEDVILQNVELDVLKGATLDYVLPQTYSEAVKENDLKVIARPNVEIKSDITKKDDDFVYIATVAVMPDVKIGDYKKIKVKRKPVKVDAKDIEETIKMIIDRFAEWKDVDRTAKKGDRTEIAFEGFDEKGNTIPNTTSKNHPIILGSNTMVPGFEDAIVGMSKNETKETKITFPKDYHSEPMKGKKVKFAITLNRLEEKAEQELNEALIEKATGKKMDIKEFKKTVEEDLKVEMINRNQQEHDNAVVSEIIKITKVEVPEVLIEQEVEGMLEEQKQRIAQQGIEWEQFLTHIKKTEDDFKKDHTKGAEDRIIARLGVQTIIKDAKITISDKEVEEKVKEIASPHPKDQQAKIKEHYKNKEQADFLRHNLAADKLIDMLSS